MPGHPLMQGENLYVISVIGLDEVGIVSKITQFLFSKGFNIVDVEQSVIHSQFTMVLLVQPESSFKKRKKVIVFDMDLKHS